jgi:hypothetical protein
VSDFASLEEAGKAFALLARLQPGSAKARVLFTLVDRRARVEADGRDLFERLVAAAEKRGWPRFETILSRSPRVEALNSASASPGSVLHHARGTLVHRQFRELAEEVAKLLALEPPARAVRLPAAPGPTPSLGSALKSALLRGLARR